MATVLMSDIVTAVKGLLSNPSKVTIVADGVFENAARLAAAHHSNRCPARTSMLLAGNDTHFIQLDGEGSSWVRNFSEILQVEYPAVDVESDTIPEFLDSSSFDIYDDGAATYLWLRDYAPDATENIRVVFTIPYVFAVVEGGETTDYSIELDDNDTIPFYWLTASIAADAMVAHYAHVYSVDSLNVSAIDWSRVSRELRSLSASFLNRYEEYVSSKGGSNIAVITSNMYPRRTVRRGYIRA